MIRFLRPFDPTRLRLLIFDLDGTLIDSRLDLIQSVNAALRHLGRPELEGDVIASYVGDGAPALMRRAVGEGSDENVFNAALEFFLVYYRKHKLDHTTLYDGVKEVLAKLSQPASQPRADEGPGRADTDATHRQMAVLSNKPVNPSRDILRALGLSDYFFRIYGGNSFATKKPDPLGVHTLLDESGVRPDEALMIGDSAVDVMTGRSAGLWTCGVSYGFAPQTLTEIPPDVLIEHPRELGEIFEQIKLR